MTCTISWFGDTQRIMLMEMRENWTWQEFYPVFTQQREMIAKVSHPHPVHTIIDMRDAHLHIPTNTIANMRNMAGNQVENSGVKVIVTSSRLVHVMFETIRRILPHKRKAMFEKYYTIVHTWDEAIEFIDAMIAKEDQQTED